MVALALAMSGAVLLVTDYLFDDTVVAIIVASSRSCSRCCGSACRCGAG